MHGQNSKENQEKLVEYYDEYVGRQKNVGVNKRHFSILNKLKQSGLKNSDSVLEIGCGIGTFTGLLIENLKEGKLVSMDISGESVLEAKRRLQSNKNLELIHADATTFDFGSSKFDVIVLPDVLEHVPIEFHFQLFKALSHVLNSNGFIFIHIPNPYYLAWCHENRPDLLQIIDQPLTTDLLIPSFYPNDLFIEKLESYSIWVKHNDYQSIVLRKNGYQDFTQTIDEKITFIDKIKHKINGIKK